MNFVGNLVPVQASYTKCGLPEFDDNPFSSVFGELPSREQIAVDISYAPELGEIRLQSPQARELGAVMVLRAVIPTNQLLDATSNIQTLARSSYLARNPKSPNFKQFRKQLVMRLRDLGEGKQLSCTRMGVALPQEAHYPLTPSMSMIGVPATGKTGTLEAVLRTYFQNRVYVHTNLGGKRITQIPYLYVHCPIGASAKQMIILLLEQLSFLTGKNFTALSKGKTDRAMEDFVLPELINLLLLYNVGFIVVDEIEMIKAAYSRGDAGLKNFWLFLMNECRLPLILIGNPDAGASFQQEMKLVMRACGGGGMIFDRLPNIPGGEFQYFLTMLWGTQVTKIWTELTPELMNEMHRWSQGLIKLVIHLYYWVQRLVIREGGDEIIKRQHIGQAFLNNAKMAEDIINGYYTGEMPGAVDANINHALIASPVKLLDGFNLRKRDSSGSQSVAAHNPVSAPAPVAAKPEGAVKTPKAKKGQRKGVPVIAPGPEVPVNIFDFAKEECKGTMTPYDLLKKHGFIANTSEFSAA